MTELTKNGFIRTRLDERLDTLTADAKTIFGSDINIDSDTMDGQHLGLFAERIASLDELAELVWQSFDPDSATGISLSRLVKLNGIERSLGAFSVVTLQLTGSANVLIPARSIVSNNSGSVVVYTKTDVRLDSVGVGEVQAQPLLMGAISAAADTLTVIKTPIYGWSTVNNETPMTVGKLEEKDKQLRLRRTRSVLRGNRNMVDALWSALSDLPGVIEARVLENDTDVVDARGLAPHSIHCVILGGEIVDIANMIWTMKTAGTTLMGQSEAGVEDAQGQTQIVRYSRPTDVRVISKVNVSPRTGWISKPTLIKQALVDWVAANMTTGDELANGALYSPLNDLGGFVIDEIQLARFGNPLLEQNLAMDFYERAILDVADIEVVIV
jgi:uncharacterized phage protein gp47/JayE